MLCLPEIVVEKPHYSVNKHTHWTWGVYQPDANWAPLLGGIADSEKEAINRALSSRDTLVQTDKNYSHLREY